MSKDTKNNCRGYKLMFVPFMGGEDYAFMYKGSFRLEELDQFTSKFDDIQDMVSNINFRLPKEERLDIIDAYIERIGGKKAKYEVIYSSDLYDFSKVISCYSDYLINNPKYFRTKSPVRFVNGKSSEYLSLASEIRDCCRIYFQDKNYRKIRGAYFELKRLGLSSRVTYKNTIDSSDYEYFTNDPYLDYLFNGGDSPDWDEIYSHYDHDELLKIVRKVKRLERINLNRGNTNEGNK